MPDVLAGMGQPGTLNEGKLTREAQVRNPGNEQDDRTQLERVREENRIRRMRYLEGINPALPNMVEKWKAEFGILDSQHILGQLYIWRGMSRGEYIALMNVAGDKWKNEESTINKCLLYPDPNKIDWIVQPAGILSTLGDLILQTSGFGPDDTVPVRL